MKKANKFTYSLAAIVSAVFLIFSSLVGGGVVAHAATSANDTVAAYEQRNVLDDLKDSTIDGEPFDLSKYNFDSKKQTQIISFVEYCYSFYSFKQQDYGLYVYVYNPQGIAFEKDNTQNYIQMAYGNSSRSDYGYLPYRLEFLNESTAAGYEGLFLKYKVVLSDTQRQDILSALNSSARIYNINEIGLVDPLEDSYPNPHSNDVFSTYIYSGYAKGYGSVSADEDTLSYTCTELTGISPTVNQTFYRLPYSNGKNSYTQDTLYSCYFAVPTELFEANGEIVEIRAKWLKAMLNWSFVTGDSEFYDFALRYMGYDVSHPQVVNGGDSSVGLSKLSNKRIYAADYDGKMVFDYGQYTSDMVAEQRDLNYGWFAGLYWAGQSGKLEELADNYVVSSEEIIAIMESYHKDYGNRTDIVVDETPANPQSGWFYPKYTYSLAPGINEFLSIEDSGVTYSYSKALFESYDSTETIIDIKRDDTFTLHGQTLDKTFWEKWFTGGSHVVENINISDIEAIHIVTSDDIKSTDKMISDNLYIDINDVSDFKSFYESNTADNNKDGKPDYTVVLLRYDVGEYSALETYLGTTNSSTLVTPNITVKNSDGRIFKQNVYLGFKVIHLVFENEQGRTVIPVAMSPQTVTGDSTGALDTNNTKLQKVINDLIAGVLGVLALIVIIVIIGIFFPPVLTFIGNALVTIFNGIVWLITEPFKAMNESAKKRREKKKLKEQ